MEQSEGKRYQPIDRKQNVLRPIDVELLIPANHPARNVWKMVGDLDLSEFEEPIVVDRETRGRNAWPPQLLISLWIYAYSRGIASAREISRQCEYEPALQWLTGLQVVNHHSLSDFRVLHGSALQDLFTQVLGILTMKGLIELERVAQDGTKIRANVNKKTFCKAGKLREHLKKAAEQVQAMQEQAQGEESGGRHRAAQQRAQREYQERLESALEELQRIQLKKKTNKQKEAQVSITDPEARFMKTADGGLAPSYNVQLVTDGAHGFIADVAVVSDPQDGSQLDPALDRMQATYSRLPDQMLADGGYTNHESVLQMAAREVDFYGYWREQQGAVSNQTGRYSRDLFTFDQTANHFICPQGKSLPYRRTQNCGGGRRNRVYAAQSNDCKQCLVQLQCCPGIKFKRHGRALSITDEHPTVSTFRKKMTTPAAKQIYRQRSRLAEFPNLWIKTKFGLTRFSSRGLSKVRCEAIWAALTFNLQRYFRICTSAAALAT